MTQPEIDDIREMVTRTHHRADLVAELKVWLDTREREIDRMQEYSAVMDGLLCRNCRTALHHKSTHAIVGEYGRWCVDCFYDAMNQEVAARNESNNGA